MAGYLTTVPDLANPLLQRAAKTRHAELERRRLFKPMSFEAGAVPTCISSCCTTCIWTRHWAVLRSSSACSVLRCLGRRTRGFMLGRAQNAAPLPGPHLGSAPTCKPPVPQQCLGTLVRRCPCQGCSGTAAQSVTSRRETKARRRSSKLGCASSLNPGGMAAVNNQPCLWQPRGV